MKRRIIYILSVFIILVFGLVIWIEHNNKPNLKEINKEPLVVLSFDDGFKTDYTIAYPLLKKHGLVATSYIMSFRLDENNERFMSWENLKELQEYGWGIEDHTYNHAKMAEISNEEIEEELKKSEEAFERNGIKKPNHLAAPFGQYNDRIVGVVKKYRKTLRTTKQQGEKGYNNWNEVDFYELKPTSIDVQDGIDRVDKIKKIIDDTFENNGILMIYGHQILDNPTRTYESNKNDFTEIVEYAASKDIKFITVDEMYNRLNENN